MMKMKHLLPQQKLKVGTKANIYTLTATREKLQELKTKVEMTKEQQISLMMMKTAQ